MDAIEEDQYHESEDEDFKLSNDNDVDDFQDEDDMDKEIRKEIKIYEKFETASGGLIKTRHGRQVESLNAAKYKYDDILDDKAVSSEVNNIWEQLKQESKSRLINNQKSRQSVMNEDEFELTEDVEGKGNKDEEEKILIERTYKFAGETIHEKKLVPKSSAMAQEYLNSIKFNQKGQNNDIEENMDDNNQIDAIQEKTNLRRPLKRPPILEAIIAGSLKPKLTTLEKSKLDWVQYIDKEGINDELSMHNKDGYLAKQDFLMRVQSAEDANYKEMRKKQLDFQLQQK